MTYYAVGATEDIGLSPYKIEGNPVVALVAQLNRFAGKALAPGGGCVTARTLVPKAFPLLPVLDNAAALSAAMIVWSRYNCVPAELKSQTKDEWAFKGLDNPWVFVMNNLNEVTTTVAQFGDKLGLDAATVGITKKDPKMAPDFPWVKVALMGALIVGAIALSRGAR